MVTDTDQWSLPERLAGEYLRQADGCVRDCVDIRTLCTDRGITISEGADLTPFGGRMVVGPDGPEIALSEAQYFRSRFTLAHELGHFAIATSARTDREARQLDEEGGARLEAACDEFAGAILFPRDHALQFAAFGEQIVPTTVQCVSRVKRLAWAGVTIRTSKLGRRLIYMRFSRLPEGNGYWLSVATGVSLPFRRWVAIEGLSPNVVDGISDQKDTMVELNLRVGSSGKPVVVSTYSLRNRSQLHCIIDAQHEPERLRTILRLESAASSYERERRLA